MLACEVRIGHRGLEVGVTDRLFHFHHILALGEPSRHAPMPEIVEVPTRGKSRALRRREDGGPQGTDAITFPVMTPRPVMVEHPFASTA